VTEAEWLACADPSPMLAHLRGHASDRKLRLFAVACCRRIWPLLTDERSRGAVEVAEAYAEGEATDRELAAASTSACDAGEDAYAGARATEDYPAAAAFQVAGAVEHLAVVPGITTAAAGPDRREELAAQAALLRCLFGNPFRPAPAADPAWLAWNDRTVPKLAEAIYEDRRFEDLPVLADALLDAGCTDAELLGHLRGPGPHARGCWALDLLLGKG
jgi:hypothetical protein